MLTPSLRRRLSELARTPPASSEWAGVRGGLAAPPPIPEPATSPGPDPAAALPAAPEEAAPRADLPPDRPILLGPYDPLAFGRAAETELGDCLRVTIALAGQLEDAAERAERLSATAARLKIEAEALCLVDIETAGLTAAPLFLIGTLSTAGGELILTQYLARSYEEEAALLDDFTRSLAACRMVVTFNGTTFDLPYLRDRAVYHRLPPPLFPDHLDLLPAARRRWRGTLPNCRLQTLEQRICRRSRPTTDVPGDQIPQLYHDYVRTGHAPLLHPVLHHNALDLLTLGELLGLLLT